MKMLKDLLTNTFQATWKTKLLTEWPSIMGNLADKVTIEKIYDDNLVLGVHDTSWLQELYMLSPVLIKTINEHLEKPYIKTVRLKHATTPKKQASSLPPVPLYTPPQPTLLTAKEKYVLQTVKDTELQKVFQTFLYRCRQEKS